MILWLVPLLLAGWMDLVSGRPDPQVPVSDGEPWEREPTVLEITQELQPTLLALSLTTLTGQHDLLPRGERAHDREQRALAGRDGRIHIQTVSPLVDHLKPQQIPLLPGLMGEFEPRLESLNRTRRQRHVFAQQAA